MICNIIRIYLCPSCPSVLFSISRTLADNFDAANPGFFKTSSTTSLYFLRIALKRCNITPRSIWCMGSRMSIWWTQKCGIDQNALKRRCALHCLRSFSYFFAAGPGRTLDPPASHVTTGNQERLSPRGSPAPPRATREISDFLLVVFLDLKKSADKNKCLQATHRWQLGGPSHVK